MLQAESYKKGGIVGDVLVLLDLCHIFLVWTSSKEVMFGSFQTVLGIKF